MKLAKLLAEKTLVVEVGLGEDPEQRLATAVTLAQVLAGEEKVEFESGAAEDLAEFVGCGFAASADGDHEAGDLCRRAQADSPARCQRAGHFGKDDDGLGVGGLLASRQPKKALEFLGRLLRDGEEPLQMLGALTWMYRKLIEASEVKGIANGWQAARALGMRPEQAELALQSARKIGKARLLTGLRALQVADSRLKGGADDPQAVMEFLLVELIGAGVARPASA